MATTTLQASLIGLPTELRLKIYDYMLQADMDCQVVDDIEYGRNRRGVHATLIPNPRPSLALAIPWLGLQSTCRTIRGELRSYIRDSACWKQNENRTYVLDIEVHGSQVSKPRRTIKWRRIPCAPNEARHLVMNVIPHSDSGPWTEGGPADLARALYQVLNHILHVGPRMLRNTLLQEHMKLQDLLINVDIGPECSTPAEGCSSNPKYNWILFQGGWTKISATGFLFDYLDVTRLKSNKDEEVRIPTEWQRVPAVIGPWKGYGFSWGIEALQCTGYYKRRFFDRILRSLSRSK